MSYIASQPERSCCIKGACDSAERTPKYNTALWRISHERRYVLTTNATIADLNLTLDAPQIVSEASASKPTGLLQRIEELLSKAFGKDEETIANSLRGL